MRGLVAQGFEAIKPVSTRIAWSSTRIEAATHAVPSPCGSCLSSGPRVQYVCIQRKVGALNTIRKTCLNDIPLRIALNNEACTRG